MTSSVTEGLREALDAALDESNNNPASPSPSAADTTDTNSVDMGYEDHAPTQRRGSMTQTQQSERRASIKAIMSDGNMTPFEKRKSIQHLMDGRRQSMSGSSSCHSSVAAFSESDNDEDKSFSDEDGGIIRSERKFAICNDQTRQAEMQRPPCEHYDRKCTLISPCCGTAFGCRICHDDCDVLPPIINKRTTIRRSASLPNMYDNPDAQYDDEDEQHHTIDRFAVREIICRECYTRQSSKT